LNFFDGVLGTYAALRSGSEKAEGYLLLALTSSEDSIPVLTCGINLRTIANAAENNRLPPKPTDNARLWENRWHQFVARFPEGHSCL
jgi:hypothetical protein